MIASLTAAAAASASPPQVEWNRVIDAEMSIAFGGATGQDLKDLGFTDPEIAAAMKRRAFDNRNEDPVEKYERILGEDNFGGFWLQADGSVLIQYVHTKPEQADMPDHAQNPFEFEQVDMTWREHMAYMDENPEEGFELQSNTHTTRHDTIPGGMHINTSCIEPVPNLSGAYVRGGTSGGVGTWTENGNRRWGVFTAGHVLQETFGCGATGVDKANATTAWMWEGPTSSPYYWDNSVFPPVLLEDGDVWVNTPPNGVGREYYMLNGEFSNGSGLDTTDIAVVKTWPKPPGRKQVHLDPKWGCSTCGDDPPGEWEHFEYFKRIRSSTPGGGVFMCFAGGDHDPANNSPAGVICGSGAGYAGEGAWIINVHDTLHSSAGDSGAPVFDGNTPNPRHIGFQFGGRQQFGQWQTVFYRTNNTIKLLREQFPDLNDLQLCTKNGTMAYERAC